MGSGAGSRGVNRVLVVVMFALVAVTGWALSTRSGGSSEEVVSPTYWVATDGDDSGPGSQDDPWATLQHAADSVAPGATVYVREGTYPQRVEFHVSGEAGRGITFAAAAGETVVLDGSTLETPAGQSAMIEIDSQRYITIDGFEITGYGSAESGHVPIGIFVTGSADHIRLSGNFIHDMGTTFQGRNGGDAHGIGVFGTTADHPIEELEIVGNELANLTLGSSEALVVNGNVKDFLIEGNRVHDTNNIGIDVIGFEGTAPDPTVDQARDGIVRGNTVWNIDSYGNPAYGDDRSADGVYVDGGRDIVVEANVIHDVNIGIEFASEHAGRSTRNITARNNLVYDSTTIGIAIGGYDRRRGSTEDCVIVNNTVVNTDGPELLVQFDTRGNLIENNVIVAGPRHVFVENPYEENVDNVLDANLYFALDGSSEGTWQWKGIDHGDFERWQAGSDNDRRSMFADPAFVNAAEHDYALGEGSPAVYAGEIWPSRARRTSPGSPGPRAARSTSAPSRSHRRLPHRPRRSPGRSPTPAISRGSGCGTGGVIPRSTGVTGSEPPTTACRSRSGPLRSSMGSARTRPRRSSWTSEADARCSSQTSAWTRRSVARDPWCSRCGEAER